MTHDQNNKEYKPLGKVGSFLLRVFEIYVAVILVGTVVIYFLGIIFSFLNLFSGFHEIIRSVVERFFS